MSRFYKIQRDNLRVKIDLRLYAGAPPIRIANELACSLTYVEKRAEIIRHAANLAHRDVSTPAFAHDQAYVDQVRAHGGFPVLNVAPYRKAARR